MPREQKRVLITGAGSGIGRALAIEAANLGMSVAICGRRKSALEATGDLIDARRRPLVISADITIAADRRRIADHIRDKWGALDVLVNNAGVIAGGPLEHVHDDALDRIFQTNVIGPIALTRDLMPLLAVARPSRIVNIGSVFGDIPYPGFSVYSASKFAMRGFSIALRRECERNGISVTYAAPRATKTDAADAFADLIVRSRMQLESPDRVAERIWRAVINGDDSVYPSGPERIYILIQRTFPRLIDWALRRQALSSAG
ncbi:SDR family NAD(P)-dependent oxidoreductase [Beijerinckia indica]|uniref:Short-chain dehydrogenase/reductase SDR n=1 Tax=Beijerinckia indica subsp. indica (strain ATCC 9039 / DSM 1715 / NCIMB 8712) TaxID=395963 RepID=B2IIW8_BEII9|nr:SDR family NAD(P)-dependent oxidoreductase [Beijerinckia indica]ACB96180.1 short-chain dehydrogenase/reductase SDR [Beijerinckia indica subsp. indica ATCC 9039]